MPTKNRKKVDISKMIVTDYDSKGNIIEDLSKVVISRERQIKLLNKINRNKMLEMRESQ